MIEIIKQTNKGNPSKKSEVTVATYRYIEGRKLKSDDLEINQN
jgi:hypothetical protein